MAIRVHERGMDLREGQWANLETMMRLGFASAPHKILALKPQSVVVQHHRRRRDGVIEVEGESQRRRTSITFVSDSFEEAEFVCKASGVFVDNELLWERQESRAAQARRQATIAAVLRGKMPQPVDAQATPLRPPLNESEANAMLAMARQWIEQSRRLDQARREATESSEPPFRNLKAGTSRAMR